MTYNAKLAPLELFGFSRFYGLTFTANLAPPKGFRAAGIDNPACLAAGPNEEPRWLLPDRRGWTERSAGKAARVPLIDYTTPSARDGEGCFFHPDVAREDMMAPTGSSS